MTSGKKVVLSTFISVLIFAVFAFFAFTQLFSLFETKFYQGNVISSMQNQLSLISKSFDEYELEYENLFSNFASLESVKKSSEQNLDSHQIKERADFAGKLISENPGFEGIRIIDSQGRKIHYSTFESDKLRQNKELINYKNYTVLDEVEYSKIAAQQDDKLKLYFDSRRNRIIFALPYIDIHDLNRGSIVFYIGADNFLNYLSSRKIISYSEKCTLYNLENESSQGTGSIVFGIPSLSGQDFLDEVGKRLSAQKSELDIVMSGEEFDWMILSSVGDSGQKFAIVFKSDILSLNLAMKILLLSCVFVTLYLLILLFFNIKQDDDVVIRNRIKNFQFSLINEYLDSKTDVDWNAISKNIVARKNELNSEIKRSLGRKAKKNAALVDSLLENSWAQIQNSIGAKSAEKTENTVTTAEIRSVLEELLKSVSSMRSEVQQITRDGVKVNSVSNVKVAQIKKTEEIGDVEELEDVEGLEEVEEVGSLEEVEELEDVEDAETVEEVETLDDVEAVEEVEDVEAVEDVEELDELEEVGSLEEVEELDEVEEPEDVEELDDAESVEDKRISSLARFAEEKHLGEGESFSTHHGSDEDKKIEFKIFNVESFVEDIESPIEEIATTETVVEEVSDVENISDTETNFVPYFSYENSIDGELAEAEKNEPVISSQEGIYQVSEDISGEDVPVNPDFQNLVNDVMHS